MLWKHPAMKQSYIAAVLGKVFPADIKTRTKFIEDVARVVIGLGNGAFPENDPAYLVWKQRRPICCLVILVFNSKTEQSINSSEMRCAYLTSSDMSVQDSAKGAGIVASSVQASLQSLKIYSLVLPSLL